MYVSGKEEFSVVLLFKTVFILNLYLRKTNN